MSIKGIPASTPPPVVRGMKIPGWVTPGGIVLAIAGFAALLVIIHLARAVGRLAGAASAVAAPAAGPKSSGGGGKKFLLAGIAATAGWVLFERHQNAAAPAKAAAAPSASPSASPSPRPAVTQTVAPHAVTAVHHLLTGGDIVAIYIVAAIVAIAIVGQVLRRSS